MYQLCIIVAVACLLPTLNLTFHITYEDIRPYKTSIGYSSRRQNRPCREVGHQHKYNLPQRELSVEIKITRERSIRSEISCMPFKNFIFSCIYTFPHKNAPLQVTFSNTKPTSPVNWIIPQENIQSYMVCM